MSFLCAHLPFLCVGLYLVYADIPGQWTLAGIMFLATLFAAVFLWKFIGNVLAPETSFKGA
ncbi:hypothetical protein [Palleronia aestuarii]|uniref:hypothetical protein n=1 Tax=Palleronia aestuarii TaxID=568105 RepID=UPI0011B5773A|nr:hypothetical protein [Palleronia aestuarii]